METQDELFDVCVVGAGASGLASAALLAEGGLRVSLLSAPPHLEEDTRTIALMQPSIRLLAHLGIWSTPLQDAAEPLRRLRIVDDTGNLFSAPTVDFAADELALDSFGWSMSLAALLAALRVSCNRNHVVPISGTATDARLDEDKVTLTLTGGGNLEAKFVVAADGSESPIRTALGLKTARWAYDQTAIATRFSHTIAHRGISTEYHRQAGPLTTVPLRGDCSGLVWLERPNRAGELMNMPDDVFARELQAAIHGNLGLIRLTARRIAVPMRGLLVPEFGARRVLLIGEAAHLIPPIGAQGLNMSLRDAATASELLLEAFSAKGKWGSDRLLKTYAFRRRQDVIPRQRIIDGFNRALLSGSLPFGAARALALSAVDKLGPLRRFVMKEGLEPSANLPAVMR